MRTPVLMLKFWLKKCALYVGIYGNCITCVLSSAKDSEKTRGLTDLPLGVLVLLCGGWLVSKTMRIRLDLFLIGSVCIKLFGLALFLCGYFPVRNPVEGQARFQDQPRSPLTNTTEAGIFIRERDQENKLNNSVETAENFTDCWQTTYCRQKQPTSQKAETSAFQGLFTPGVVRVALANAHQTTQPEGVGSTNGRWEMHNAKRRVVKRPSQVGSGFQRSRTQIQEVLCAEHFSPINELLPGNRQFKHQTLAPERNVAQTLTFGSNPNCCLLTFGCNETSLLSACLPRFEITGLRTVQTYGWCLNCLLIIIIIIIIIIYLI